jgi:geranylgeranyl diphosphate synthase type II
MQSIAHFQQKIEKGLQNLSSDGKPAELYEPIRYMLQLGGKRIRPALLLMSHEMFGGNPDDVMNPALGIEVFHNFTLLHDDIMDKAPLRRSQQTVHEKWNTDIAILSGDTMFVQSCQLMMDVKSDHIKDVLHLFFKTAIEVCEGQQWDMNFESLDSVSIDEYIHMIGLKTAVLLGCSLSVGAICANAPKSDSDHLYEFGKNLGVAFQLQDDILDAYGDAEKFGKQVGGDIISNKKTFLLITALQQAKGDVSVELKQWTQSKSFDPKKKVEAVKAIFDSLSIRSQAEAAMNSYFVKAMKHLEDINLSATKKELLTDFAEKLMVRER